MTQTTATQRGSEQASDKTAIRPFHVNVPEAELTELRRRINATKWPERETVTDAIARSTARDDSGAGALLGDRVRLAQDRGETERPAAVHHRDRWAGHSFHSRPFETRKCVAADRYARMARLDHRTDEDHRSADQSHRTRRKCIRRVRCRDSVDARLRFFRQADHDRVGPRPHCTCLDRADEAPRIHEIRGAGRRLGCSHHRADGRAGATGIAGHSHQHGGRDSARHRQAGLFRRAGAGESLGRREARLRAAELRLCKGHRLRLPDGVATADAVRNRGFTRRPGGLFPRSRRAQLRDDRTCLCRRERRPHARRRPRQHHAHLVDEYGAFRGPSLLGEQGCSRSSASKASSSRPP